MKPSITLSINPWYYCNFRCDFCYLTEAQLSDKTTLSLPRLQELLAEVSESYTIDHIDLYGGEVFLLPKQYLLDLRDMLLEYVPTIHVNTNLSLVNEVVKDPAWHLSVSYDFEAREKSDVVMFNMFKLEREFSVLMLAGPVLMQKRVDDIVSFFNMFTHLKTVEVKPYSANQANNLPVTFTDYEEFVKKLITARIPKNFSLTNEHLLDDVLDGDANSFSDDHIYITPNGKLAVLEFDDQDKEFFLELDSVQAYQDWTQEEKVRVAGNAHCSSCEYFGKCLSEHLREVKNPENSCSGFYKLIEWRGKTNG